MHYLMEVVMPPTDDVEAALEVILKDYCEHGEDNEHAFWDWYVIGGRYSGAKMEAALPKEKMDAFYAELKERKITVAGLVCGKQTLKPESQIPMVDALWRDYFPGSPFKECPLFEHAGPRLAGDVMRVADLPNSTNAARFLVAAPSYDGSMIEPTFMLAEDFWNGTNHQKTAWGGSVLEAIAQYAEDRKHYKEDYREKTAIKPDWLCVTVDYHT